MSVVHDTLGEALHEGDFSVGKLDLVPHSVSQPGVFGFAGLLNGAIRLCGGACGGGKGKEDGAGSTRLVLDLENIYLNNNNIDASRFHSFSLSLLCM